MSLLGERLRQAREALGISTYQAEIDTRIRAAVIESLEEGAYDELPPAPFLRGLIRTYSNYLGVNPDEMLELWNADLTPLPPPPPAPRIVKISQPPPTPPQPQPSPVLPPLVEAEPAPDPARRRRQISPPPLMPKPPDAPEKLLPPETLEPTSTAETGRISLAHLTRRPAPLAAIIVVGAIAFFVCVSLAAVAAAQMVNMIANAQPTVTPTRLLPTRTPTLIPGALPTGVPTLIATAPPFPTFPGGPTTAAQVTPRRTLESITGLNLTVDVTQTITLQVGIDGVMVYDGPMAPGNSRAWSARDTLYVRVENPRGAILSLNNSTKYFGARNFAETKIIERQWTLNDKGAVVNQAPQPPPKLTPTITPAISTPAPIKTPTLSF
ncbi:MAG: helix-turn-helix domain-containing protein [Chloroflexi bacterium]|nr:helix-turn-helix domain-containing protein [Chloroflexota bacterium]